MTAGWLVSLAPMMVTTTVFLVPSILLTVRLSFTVVAGCQVLNRTLAVIGGIVPVAGSVYREAAVGAVERFCDKGRLSGISVGDVQFTGDLQQVVTIRIDILGDAASVGASNYGGLVGFVSTVDGNHHGFLGAVDTADGQAVFYMSHRLPGSESHSGCYWRHSSSCRQRLS